MYIVIIEWTLALTLLTGAGMLQIATINKETKASFDRMWKEYVEDEK